MKILVTGGAGFIGSALVRNAISLGHQVLNLDALTYASCLKSLSSVNKHPNYKFVHGDIGDRSLVDEVLGAFVPDVVMHLAAESHVDRSIDGPDAFIKTNINGTFQLLEAARDYWVSRGKPEGFRFHHVSTDEVFGSLPLDDKVQFSEDSHYNPRSPYSASKAASDHLVRSWFSTYSLPAVLTNCSNNYGPYHFPEKLIPVIILNAIAGENIPIYGDGTNVRDWLFVDDHVDALLLVAKAGSPGRSYNIGGQNELSNLDLANKICSILDRKISNAKGSYSELIHFVPDRPGHDVRYSVDPTRIRNELGWVPKTSIEQGLEKTVSWYLKNEEWWKPLQNKAKFGKRIGLL